MRLSTTTARVLTSSLATVVMVRAVSMERWGTDGLVACTKCAGSNNTTGCVEEHTVDGRSYLVFVPDSYDKDAGAPLILSYHGASQTPKSQCVLDQLTNPYFNTKYIVVYPEGADVSFDSCALVATVAGAHMETNDVRSVQGEWEGAPGHNVDDVGFTKSILSAVEARYNIKSSQIYATGKSQGGGFVGNHLACDAELSTQIAAFAPVSGAFYVAGMTTCKPDTVQIPCNKGRTDVPLIEFHGGADGTIPYEGGPRKSECLPSIQHWIEAWAGRDGLGTDGTITALTGDATREVFGASGLVQHIYSGDRVDHSWPATFSNSDNEGHGDGPASFNATSIIVAWFDKYALS